MERIGRGERPKFRLFLRSFEEEYQSVHKERFRFADLINLKLPMNVHAAIDFCFEEDTPTIMVGLDSGRKEPGFSVLTFDSGSWAEKVLLLINHSETVFFLEPMKMTEGVLKEKKMIIESGGWQKCIFIFADKVLEFAKSQPHSHLAAGRGSCLEQLGWPHIVTLYPDVRGHDSLRSALHYLRTGELLSKEDERSRWVIVENQRIAAEGKRIFRLTKEDYLDGWTSSAYDD